MGFLDFITASQRNLPLSVCLLVLGEHGKVLVVERRTGGFGMPGGKVEPGETVGQAAQRELFEETGLEAGIMIGRLCASPEGEFLCTMFEVLEWRGEPRPSAEGAVRWVEPEELAEAPPFAEFNARALRAAGVLP